MKPKIPKIFFFLEYGLRFTHAFIYDNVTLSFPILLCLFSIDFWDTSSLFPMKIQVAREVIGM